MDATQGEQITLLLSVRLLTTSDNHCVGVSAHRQQSKATIPQHHYRSFSRSRGEEFSNLTTSSRASAPIQDAASLLKIPHPPPSRPHSRLRREIQVDHCDSGVGFLDARLPSSETKRVENASERSSLGLTNRLSHRTRTTSTSSPRPRTLSGVGTSSSHRHSQSLSRPSATSTVHDLNISTMTDAILKQADVKAKHEDRRRFADGNHSSETPVSLSTCARRNNILSVDNPAAVPAILPRAGPHSRLESWRQEVARDVHAHARLSSGIPEPALQRRSSISRGRTFALDIPAHHQPSALRSAIAAGSGPVAGPAIPHVPKIRSARTVPPLDFRPPLRVSAPRISNSRERPSTSKPQPRFVQGERERRGEARASTPLPSSLTLPSQVTAIPQSKTLHHNRQRTSSSPYPSKPTTDTIIMNNINANAKPLPSLPPPSPTQKPAKKVVYKEYTYGPEDEFISVYSSSSSTHSYDPPPRPYAGQHAINIHGPQSKQRRHSGVGKLTKVNGYGERLDLDHLEARERYRRWYAQNAQEVDISTERARSPSEY